MSCLILMVVVGCLIVIGLVVFIVNSVVVCVFFAFVACCFG